MTPSVELSQLFQVLAILVLLMLALISCVISVPTSVPIPSTSPKVTTIDTPEPPSVTTELRADELLNNFKLPAATPAPTFTPNVIIETDIENLETKRLQKKSLLGIYTPFNTLDVII